MILGGVLAQGRAWANSRMTQTWRVGTLVEVTDPLTLDVTKTIQAVYAGPARFKVTVSIPSVEEVPGQAVAVQDQELHLPSGTSGIETGMVAVCDACPEDQSLVGRVLRIKGAPAAGQTTAARFPVEETGETVE